MRAVKIVFNAAAIMFLCLPALAQPRRLMGGSAGGSRYTFFYSTYLEPSAPELSLGGGTIGGEGTIHRFMWDPRRQVYFGYDILIEALPGPDVYRMALSQLTMTAENIRRTFGNDGAGWTAIPTPDWSASAVRTVRAGEVLSLDLLSNSTTGQKIVDYITVQAPSSPRPSQLGPLPLNFVNETGTPRDFRAEDGELKIEMDGVSVGGNLIPLKGGMSGAAVYFYLPMRGRFILSLTPHPELGFRQAGEIRGSLISFTTNSDTVTIVSSGRIAPGRGPFNLYVLHEPAWLPRGGNRSGAQLGAAARADQLMGN